MTRLVIDASVLVSAIVSRGESYPWLVVQAVRAGVIEMIACDHLLDEVARALRGRYFAERLTIGEADAAVEALRTVAELLPDPVAPPRVLRDADDDYLLALAIAGGAAAVVTGDRDLLDHEGLMPPALTAREACRHLGLAES